MTQTTNPAPQAPPDTVTLSVDGRSVTTRKGTLLIEAAKQVGIEIPVFCYEPRLKPVGACRMCLVQIEKMPRLQTACTTPVAQDMVVSTNSKEVIAAQNGVIELLLANHPLDCPICDKGGECPLQDNTFNYGLGTSRFTEEKRHLEKALPLSDRIVLDRERCIMCYRCVRFHQEITGDESLAAADRGAGTEIGTLPGESYDSIFSGNTVELCPVGALTSRKYRFKARPWDLVRTPSVCNGCAVGCNLEVHSRTETVLRLVSRRNVEVDDGWLCDAGRWGTLPAARELRPARPAVRWPEPGPPEVVDWDVALTRAAALLGRARSGVLLSGGLSNEALWLAQHALRSRLNEGARLALWPPVGDTWPVEGAIANLPGCKKIVLVGLDAWYDLPVLALWLRRAVQNGAALVHIGSTNGLFRDTAHWLKTDPGHEGDTAVALLAALNGQPKRRTGQAEAVARAADALRGVDGPAALLIHPGTLSASSATVRRSLEELARVIGADGSTGLLGAPALAANGRGAQELTPEIAGTNPADVLAAAQRGEIGTLLLLGDETWGELDTGGARVIVATSRPVLADDRRVNVVLPLSHPYERQGTITNLEGRVQFQEGGAAPPVHARPDWGVVATLAERLGATDVPNHLPAIRAAVARTHPAWAGTLDASPLRSFVS